jgi:hypothetical protein
MDRLDLASLAATGSMPRPVWIAATIASSARPAPPRHALLPAAPFLRLTRRSNAVASHNRLQTLDLKRRAFFSLKIWVLIRRNQIEPY